MIRTRIHATPVLNNSWVSSTVFPRVEFPAPLGPGWSDIMLYDSRVVWIQVQAWMEFGKSLFSRGEFLNSWAGSRLKHETYQTDIVKYVRWIILISYSYTITKWHRIILLPWQEKSALHMSWRILSLFLKGNQHQDQTCNDAKRTNHREAHHQFVVTLWEMFFRLECRRLHVSLQDVSGLSKKHVWCICQHLQWRICRQSFNLQSSWDILLCCGRRNIYW